MVTGVGGACGSQQRLVYTPSAERDKVSSSERTQKEWIDSGEDLLRRARQPPTALSGAREEILFSPEVSQPYPKSG